LKGDVQQISCFDESNFDNTSIFQAFYDSDLYRFSDVLLVSSRFRERECVSGGGLKQSKDLSGLPYLIRQGVKDGKGVIVLGNTTEFSSVKGKTIVDYFVQEKKAGGNLRWILHEEQAYMKFVGRVNSYYYQNGNRKVRINRAIREISENYNVHFFDKHDVVCDEVEGRCFGLTPEGYKSFYDYGHYTLRGAKFFGRRMFDLGFLDVLQNSSEVSRDGG